MAVLRGWTSFTTLAFFFQFWFGASMCLAAILYGFLFSFELRLLATFIFQCGHLGFFAFYRFYLPSFLGPNCCKVVKTIYTMCQKYKNTASFLFSCFYLILSVHPIVVENAAPPSPHVAVLCGVSGAVISWVKLAASSRIASSIFACWFLPSSIVAPIYLSRMHDPTWYFPALAAIFSLIVPVDYKVLLRLRLIKRQPGDNQLEKCP